MHQVIIYIISITISSYKILSISFQLECPICRETLQPQKLVFLQNYDPPEGWREMPYSTYSISSWKYERMNHACVNKLKKRTVIMRVLQIFSKVTLVSLVVIICYKLCNILILFNWFRYNHIKLFLLQW